MSVGIDDDDGVGLCQTELWVTMELTYSDVFCLVCGCLVFVACVMLGLLSLHTGHHVGACSKR
jgi:hypothetical protein